MKIYKERMILKLLKPSAAQVNKNETKKYKKLKKPQIILN